MKNTKEYDASVILLTYNQTENLILQLLSLIHQHTKFSFEIIISEDGSNSFDDKRIKKIIKTSSFPIKYVWQQDLGWRASHARNNGIKLSTGKILIFLDGDMIPDENFVEAHLLSHHKSKMMVAGNRKRRIRTTFSKDLTDKMNIQGILKCLDVEKIRGEIKRRQLNEETKRNEYVLSNNPWRVCFSCNLSIDNLPEVLFDENFVGWGTEDWELAHRLSTYYDYTPVYNHNIIAYEIETESEVGNVFRGENHEKIVLFLKNTFYFFDRCPGLTLKEAFWCFPKLYFNEHTKRWGVDKNPGYTDHLELERIVKFARNWLKKNKIYQ